jgi:hypothetical protein
MRFEEPIWDGEFFRAVTETFRAFSGRTLSRFQGGSPMTAFR